MSVPQASETKQSPVEQLRGILAKFGQMDYYQIIGVEAGAADGVIRKQFYGRSMRYHPDRYHYVDDPEFKRLVTTIYKQISEAYNVLKDPKTRREYDQRLTANRTENLRYRTQDKMKQDKEFDGGAGPGAKYYRLAKQALAGKNLAGARNNIKLALTMEAKNEHFLALQKEIEGAA